MIMKNLFTFEKACDPQLEDDQYVLNANPDIYVQVCHYAGGYNVGEFKDNMMFDYGTFKTQQEAFAKAVAVNEGV